jgi:hypothetical protein
VTELKDARPEPAEPVLPAAEVDACLDVQRDRADRKRLLAHTGVQRTFLPAGGLPAGGLPAGGASAALPQRPDTRDPAGAPSGAPAGAESAEAVASVDSAPTSTGAGVAASSLAAPASASVPASSKWADEAHARPAQLAEHAESELLPSAVLAAQRASDSAAPPPVAASIPTSGLSGASWAMILAGVVAVGLLLWVVTRSDHREDGRAIAPAHSSLEVPASIGVEPAPHPGPPSEDPSPGAAPSTLGSGASEPGPAPAPVAPGSVEPEPPAPSTTRPVPQPEPSSAAPIPQPPAPPSSSSSSPPAGSASSEPRFPLQGAGKPGQRGDGTKDAP